MAQPLAVEVVDELVVAQDHAQARDADALARADDLDDAADGPLAERERRVGGVDLQPGRLRPARVGWVLSAVRRHASGDQSPSKSGSESERTTAACATSGATVRKSAESRRSETLA